MPAARSCGQLCGANGYSGLHNVEMDAMKQYKAGDKLAGLRPLNTGV